MDDRIQTTKEQVTAFTLSRQGLLEPFSRRDVASLVSDVCGLHAQILSTCPLQLWARVKGFRMEDFSDALYRRRTVVRTWAVRATLHILPSDSLETFLSAIGPYWLNAWTTVRRKIETELRASDLDRARAALAAAFRKGPMSRKELVETVRVPSVDRVVSVAGWEATLRFLSFWGDIVHGEMRGPEVVFHDAEGWLGRPIRLREATEAAGELLATYLQALGPASPQDFGRWTALRAPQVQAAFNHLDDSLVEVSVDGMRRALFLHHRDVTALERSAIPQNHIRLLPKFDPIMLGHADRSRILDREHHRTVFGAVADQKATLLVAGRVTGTWKHTLRGRLLHITVTPFRPLTPAERSKVQELAGDLASFLDSSDVHVTFDSAVAGA